MTTGARAVGLVLAVTVVVSIGLPIIGIGSFHATDVIGSMPPWSQQTPYEFRPDNGQVTDTVNGVVPARAAFRARVWEGDLPLWDPLRGPGEPLAAVPNVGTFSPLTLAWVVAPLWLAPVLTKLVQVAVAVAGMFLLCRAWGLGRAASLVGALAFVNSAFLVVWTNWPQSMVGALVPLLLWAVERGCAAPRHWRAWPVAPVVAVMWLEGFPSVTAYALLVAGAYAAVRTSLVHGRTWRSVARLLSLGAAVLLGLALAAIQLLPFLAFLESLDLAGRTRVAGVPLPWHQLATLAVPDAFGNPVDRAAYGTVNYVEGQSWVGVVVLVLVALLVVARGRAGAPRGVLPFLGVLGAVGIVLVYLDSPLLDLFGRVPLLGTNNIGRFRAVLGVAAAAGAAFGYDAFVEGDAGFDSRRAGLALGVVALVTTPLVAVAAVAAAAADRLGYFVVQLALPVLVGALVVVVVLTRARGWVIRPRHVAVAGGALVVGGVLAGGLAVATGVVGREVAGVDAGALQDFVRSLALPAAVGTVALGLVLSLLLQAGPDRRRTARRAAAIALPVLLAAEAVAFANPWFARTPRALFFPQTATHEFLDASLGTDRFAAAGTTLYSSTNGVYGLRSVTSHSFMPPTYRELLRALEPDAFARSSTFPFLDADEATAVSPLLDRAAARYWAVGPLDPLLGTVRQEVTGAAPLRLASGESAESVLAGGLLRGVTLELSGTTGLAGRPAIVVEVVTPDGTRVADGATRLHWWVEPGPLPVAFPEVDVPAGSSVRVTLEGAEAGSVTLAADGRSPAVGATLAADDGLRLVHADGAVLYERLGALPRVRWAGRTVTEPDPERRLARLAAGVPSDVVVLGEGAVADGTTSPAAVDVVRDAGDVIEVRITADGAGHLVVADGIQRGWRAELDGQRVPIVAADHAFGAVAVPAGEHHVRLWYHPAGWTEGQLITLAALVVLAGWVVVDLRSRTGRAPRDRNGVRGQPG